MNGDQISIRKAVMSDLDTLLRFEQGVISAERPFDPTLKPGEINYYDIPAMINASHIELVVATQGDVLVGCGYARIETAKHYLQHPQHAYLGFMYVLPEHRGKGINKIVIEALKAWTRSQGLTELRLDVYYDNLSAVGAYEKSGFAKHMIEMRMDLK